MPFGLKGAPGTFQANVNTILGELVGNGVAVYMDDILIHSEDEESHARLLREVLRRLWKHRLFPKFRKCRFALRKIEYLGFTIDADGIRPSDEKIKAILNWPEELANDTQVRQFLGTVNFVRPHAGPEYAEHERPLVDLTRKNVPFVWTERHSEALRAIKRLAADYIKLKPPDVSKPFELYTDASDYAIGAVLMQEKRR